MSAFQKILGNIPFLMAWTTNNILVEWGLQLNVLQLHELTLLLHKDSPW